MASKIKLTKAQKKVIELLQKGEVIVNNDHYFYVSDKFTQHRIDWRVWDRLTQHGKQVWERQDAIIYQQLEWPFNYVLTKKGRDIKL